jgi:NDP-sugar pyrophosphorylase family protein
MADRIVQFLGSGEQFGVTIDYLHEEVPRGTAGALSLMEASDEPILVINGDILTTVDLRQMMHFHREHDAALTVAVRSFDVQVPYGVMELDGTTVRGIVEKPTYAYFANAGIYFLEPRVYRMIPRDSKYDMTDLITQLCAARECVAAFPIYEYWRDLGRPEDYESAKSETIIASKTRA